MPCGWFVRGVGAAQQPQRAAPHTGVPEIGATLCGCYAGAVGGAQGQLNTAGQTSTGVEPIAMAGSVLGTWRLYVKLACSPCFISAVCSLTYSDAVFDRMAVDGLLQTPLGLCCARLPAWSERPRSQAHPWCAGASSARSAHASG